MARINAEIGMSMSHLKSKASPRETDIYATLQRNIHQVPRSDSAKIWHKDTCFEKSALNELLVATRRATYVKSNR
ncbi:hypothetical protein L596_024895 [Steinernema carpocapsae]|uniref:Uncharacterized protein n=1 Tax=Steinernema carpocapsae TaxID=34508 RepID=A0A4U5M654_STECR|nr:hypothetical protein L596_024895 [Steinernema carpocapsae]